MLLFKQSENEEEAAVAYDIAAIRVKGAEAITNFDKSQYDVNGITASEKIPIGKGVSRFLKENSVNDVLMIKRRRTSRPIILRPKRDGSHQVMNPQLGLSSQSLASSEEQRNQINQMNVDDFSWPLQGQQNPIEFQTNNSSAAANLCGGLGFSSDDGVLEGLLAMIDDGENQQFTQQVLDAYPSSSLMKAYETPGNFPFQDHQIGLQTNNPSFLNHQLSGDGSGSASSIKYNGGVWSGGILEGYTTMMGNVDEDFAFDDFLDMQQISTDGNFPKMPSPQNQDSLFQLNGIHLGGNSKSSHDGATIVLAKDKEKQ